jgi:hypothetical protein
MFVQFPHLGLQAFFNIKNLLQKYLLFQINVYF